MSSMRNAAPRRPHRERSQPGNRQKWGLLEKHKDYSLRAADYNKKKAKLNILSQKTREKNPDEFAFGMLRGDSQKAGKHGRGDGDKNRLSVQEVRLLKGQDAGYLRTVLGRTRKEVSKVREEIAIDGVMKRRGFGLEENEKKIVYGDDGEPVQKRRKLSIDMDNEDDILDDFSDDAFDGQDSDVAESETIAVSENVDVPLIVENIAASEDEGSETEQTKKSVSKKHAQAAANAAARAKVLKRHRKRIREARTAKLEALKKRQKSIVAAAQELEMQRARMARTVGGTNKNGVKFKVRERKR